MEWTEHTTAAIDMALAGKDVALKGGHGTGSTMMLAAVTVALVRVVPEVTVLLTGSSRRRINDILLPDIRQILADEGDDNARVGKSGVSIGRSRAAYWCYTDKDNLDFLRGRTGRLVLIVEGAESVPAHALTDLEDHLGRSVQTVMSGVPLFHRGLLWHAFRWNRLSASAEDSQYVSSAYIAEIKKQYGEDSDTYISRVRGEFPQ